MSKRRVMISGYYGFENFGDDLILYVLVDYLKAFGVQPIVLSGNPELTTRMFQVESLPRTEIHHIWRVMDEVDAFISGGGGLFQDVTGLGSPLYYGGLIEMAHWKKLPVAFFGQGVGPLRTMPGRFMLKRALHHASLVTVRDVKSQALIQQLTDRKADLMADPVWAWQPDESLLKLPRRQLGLSLRPWPHLQQPQLIHLADCIAGLPGIRERGVNLIDCQAGMDITPLAKMETLLKERSIACQWFSESHCITGIAQSAVVVGMRFHALLMAAQLGIPAVALSYDPKVQLLAAQLKITDFPVIELEELTSQLLSESICLPDQEAVETLRTAALQGFVKLKAWLS